MSTKSFNDISEIIKTEINGEEKYYYNHHIKRYERMFNSIIKLSNKRKIVLNIGSHYLHQAMLLSLSGFDVICVDIPNFANQKNIKERAKKFNINLFAINDLENGINILIEKKSIDIILFTEILEHITFNPVKFWRSISSIMSKKSFIYISTPNSMRLLNIISTVYNAMLMRRIGLDTISILNQDTYGHHWKEYSAKEIKYYFNEINPNFNIKIYYYHYREITKIKGLKSFLRKIIILTGRFFRVFSDELEIIVYKNRKH